MFSTSTVVAIAAFAVLALFLKVAHVGRRPKSLPPGPPTLPLIGNLHLMPTKRPWLQFQKWAQEYGPIYSLILGTKTYVVLSSPETIKDLLDKRSNIYSTRPEMYMGQTIASGGLRLVMLEYGSLWRTHHKMIHNILNIKAAVTYVPYQDLESKQMLVGLLDQPKTFVEELQRFTISLTTQTIYGFRTSAIGDPKVNQFFECFENWGKLVEGAASQFLDLYPILRKLPPALRPQYRYAQNLHKIEMGLYKGHWMEAKEHLQNGTGKPCFANDLLRVQEKAGMNDDEAAYLCGSLLEAGSDTTSSILIGFVQAMLVFPEVQRKAQAAIDSVVGPDRLPTMEDASQLPYIWCCVKEAIRWMPTTVLGAPHANLQDDVYKGYTIPAGTTVINNVWALQMDPERNPEPRQFNPDRFADNIESEFVSATAGDPSKRNNYIFGAGRRLCQGMHIAERSLFLGISRLVWGFDFDRAVDAATGQPKPLPDIEDLVGGLTIRPADFEVKITPRSTEREQVIRKNWQECEETVLDTATKQWKKIPEGMAFTTLVVEKSDD